ncbi:hypothetical protein [Flavobacterium sp. XGLA_31]|uniref:hypothetical protein n=1 Tax=Flavobacterium sp. XGLA_31 TaxID=3447666 RepID=UPI003F3B4317
MKKTLLLSLLLSFLALSCGSDSGGGTENTALNLVTGIYCRQTADDVALRLGNPNVFTQSQFVMYPNPATQFVMVVAQEPITDAWIVPATPQKIFQSTDFNTVLHSDLYTEQTLTANADISLHDSTSGNLLLEIADLPKGYYRIVVKIGGALYWDNLYKYSAQESNEDQFNAISSFWQ